MKAFGIIAVSILVIIFLYNKKSVNYSKMQIHSAVKKLRYKKNDNVLQQKNVATKNNDAFIPEFTDEAIKIVDDSKRYIRARDREEFFIASNLDSRENYKKSLLCLQEGYKFSYKDIAKRILALKFISMSQYLRIDDCLDALRVMTNQMREIKDKNLELVFALDVYEMAQNCAKIELVETDKFANSLDLQRAKKAIRLAVNYVKEGSML